MLRRTSTSSSISRTEPAMMNSRGWGVDPPKISHSRGLRHGLAAGRNQDPDGPGDDAHGEWGLTTRLAIELNRLDFFRLSQNFAAAGMAKRGGISQRSRPNAERSQTTRRLCGRLSARTTTT